MALALDGSTPARATATTTQVTSGAFTPPAGALLVVCTSGSGGSQNNPTVTVSTITGSTSSWTELGRATGTQTGTSNDGMAAVHWATVTSSVSTTVRSTQTSGSSPTSIKIYVITGFDTGTPVGSELIGTTTTNTLVTTAFDTTQNNVWAGVSATEWTAPSSPPPSSDLTIGEDLYQQGTSLHGGSGFKAVATAGTSTTLSIDSAGTAGREWMWVSFEVYEAGGTPGNVSAVTATATAEAPVPAVTAEAQVAAVTATATAEAPVPAVTAEANVAAVCATATAEAPAPAVSGGGGGGTLTFTAGTAIETTASVTSTEVPLPSGLEDGDYTIIIFALNVSSGSITTPSGWTDILASTATVNGSAACKIAVFYRKWVSGDGNPTVTTNSGRTGAVGIRVQGADQTTFVDQTSSVSQMASGVTTITAPTLTPTSEWLCCVMGGRRAESNVFVTPFTNLTSGLTMGGEACGKSTATNAGVMLGYEQVTADVATGTRSADAAGATTGALAFSFSLNAAAGGGTPGNVSAVTATATATAPAPAVGGAANVAGVAATATTTALAPAVSAAATVTSVVATATATAPAPAVTAAATVASVVATATGTAPVPAVTAAATVSAVLATATAQAHAPTVTAAGQGTVSAVAMTATAQAHAPAVTAAASVSAVTATATALAPAPTVSAAGQGNVSAPAATATAEMLAPTVTSAVNIAGTCGTATAVLHAPTVTAGAEGVVNATTATATAQAHAPVVTSGAVVAAVTATATALAHSPAVAGDVAVMAAVATAAAEFMAPTITGAYVAYVPTATAIATMWEPLVTTVDQSDIHLVGEALAVRWSRLPLADRWHVEAAADRYAVEEWWLALVDTYDVQEWPDRFTGRPDEGDRMAVEVLASAGAVKFVGGTVTETSGADISGSTFEMSLGSQTYPGTTWVAPDVSAAGDSNAERVLKLKVSSALPAGIVVPGTYWCWARITDASEVEPVRLQGPITVR